MDSLSRLLETFATLLTCDLHPMLCLNSAACRVYRRTNRKGIAISRMQILRGILVFPNAAMMSVIGCIPNDRRSTMTLIAGITRNDQSTRKVSDPLRVNG